MPSASDVVLFRADASLDIGSGHVMRCLTLAGGLRQAGYRCVFACRSHPGHLLERIEQAGFEARPLSSSIGQSNSGESDFSPYQSWLGVTSEADAGDTVAACRDLLPAWCVVDHYALSAPWERMLSRRLGCRVCVVDDLADRPHHASLLLDQNLGRRKMDYHDLVPDETCLLVGPEYALLRDEFFSERKASLARRQHGRLQHILLSMGGVDRDNISGMVLSLLSRPGVLPEGARVTVVLGGQSPALPLVEAQLAGLDFPVFLEVDSQRMAALLREADLVIGAAGSSSWERCCLGVPTLLAVLADNQKKVAESLGASGAAECLGTPPELAASLAPALDRLKDPVALGTMSTKAASLVDGKGTKRVVDALLTLQEQS